jgi:hypothetical protein
MRIKFLTSIASEDWAYAAGQIAFIETSLAQKWIGSGIAVSLEPANSGAAAVAIAAHNPGPAIAKSRSQALREEIEQARKTIASKRVELAETTQAAQGASVDAILTGKKSRAPVLLTKARELESQIEELKATLQPLERALQIVSSEESDIAARAEETRIAQLKAQHRAAVATLIEAIESGDRLAASRIVDAEMTIARIRFGFPEKKQPASIVVQNAAMITVDEQMRLHLFAQLCEAGFSDLFTPDHIARRRYEHQRAHDLRQQERIERERAARAVRADASIVSDEFAGVLPDRSGKMTYR